MGNSCLYNIEKQQLKKHLIVHCGFTSTETLRLIQDEEPRTHTPSIAFRHLSNEKLLVS